MSELTTVSCFRRKFLFLIVPDDSSKMLWAPGLHLRDFHDQPGVAIPMPASITIPAQSTAKVHLGIRAVCLRLKIWGSLESSGWDVTPPEITKTSFSSGYRILPNKQITPLVFGEYARPDNRIDEIDAVIDHNISAPIVVRINNYSDLPFTVEEGEQIYQLVSPQMRPADYLVLTPGDPRVQKYFGGTV